jgi:hypothetical protein
MFTRQFLWEKGIRRETEINSLFCVIDVALLWLMYPCRDSFEQAPCSLQSDKITNLKIERTNIGLFCDVDANSANRGEWSA